MASVSKHLRDKIAKEALHRCGYCLTDQRISGAQMQVEHIIPQIKNGLSEVQNLWLSCAWCNSYKGTKTEAIDPDSGVQVLLFNPRRQNWFEHFTWDSQGVQIIGITSIGRATVEALKLNNKYIIPARKLWVIAGWHPPS